MAAGLYGGLLRLGVPLPLHDRALELHGILMVAAVFGGLIGLERAVAMGSGWAFVAPMLALSGGVSLVAGLPVELGGALLVGSAAVFAMVSLRIAALQPAIFTVLLAIGAVAQLVGNAVWLTSGSAPAAAGWWVAFLVLTIAGERLELSRIAGSGRLAGWVLVGVLAFVLAGSAFGITEQSGRLLLALGLSGLTAWLLRYDIAMTTIHLAGRTRFFAVAMLCGYFWLGASAVILCLGGAGAFTYDAIMHAVLIGFVLSMVFGHALIILPAITGVRPRYHWTLFLPLLLLQVSAAMRIAGGLLELQSIRQGSGIVTVSAIILFAATMTIASLRSDPGARDTRLSKFPR